MLLERHDELSVLRALAGAASQGHPGLLVIEGPAAIGKSRLLAEARREARAAGVTVLSARAGELERGLAFGVVRQLFEGAVSEPWFAGAAAAAREVFDGPATGVGFEDASFAILHALYRLTIALAEDAPLLLVVDDLQWCDEPSLRWLCYLVRRLDGLRGTLVLGVRPFERHPHAHLIGEIARDPLTVALQPKPLTERACAALLEDGADEAFTRACHRATGGNPLLLVELAKTLRAEGVTPDAAHLADVDALAPRAASRAVLVRIGRLSAGAAAVARATAVLGDDAALPLVAELAGLDDVAAVAAAGELVGAEVFADDVAMAFVHPVIRAAVYEDVPVHQRSVAHERAARLLRDRASSPGPVATQLMHAPERGEAWVVDTLAEAARAAQRAGSATSATSYLTRALAEPPPAERRAQVLLALANVEKGHNLSDSVEHLTAALELMEDPLARGAAALQLARALAMSRRADEGVALARRTMKELPPDAGLLLAALEALQLTAPLLGASEPVPAERFERHRRLPLAPGAGPKLLAAIAAHQWAYGGGSAAECAALALASLEGWELIRAENLVLSVAATLVLVLADRDEALDAWAALLAGAHARGSLSAKAATSVFRGYTLYRHGELAEAEASLRDAVEELTLGNLGGEGRTETAAWLAGVLRERGDLAGARGELEAVSDRGDASHGTRYWLDSLTEQLLAEERYEEALAHAREAARRFAHLSAVDTPARAHQAVALQQLGRREEALALAAEEVEAARRWGAPSIVARALRVLGTLEHAEGIGHLQEAVALAQRSPARLEHAKALAALGGALRAARRPTEARDPLRQALELAHARGASSLASRVRSELYAAGGRPRTTALQGLAALTPSERRVAERAAAGQTNRAIAEALFVTPKTVELHLRNAYRKLGAQKRHELAALLEPTTELTAGR
ncbi:AAA family ATPase [Solirubrobacter ginsenosidimutans]|uniref:AAA family ATPase n=1 Tax=Solirubrobacter ginsenosidimutans TaxID=490573 RepID=A0A9X3MVS5_9ACTN|nr:LuxR family transcriptional regulator [Solirubrobacter ginsenosidimutans]MDA0160868.1 AAA family ATPase [Solirubrobacter ginsenosidimutans]